MKLNCLFQESGAQIGQRDGLSEKDVLKLAKMYGCNKGEDEEYSEEQMEEEENSDVEEEENPDVEEEEESFMIIS